MPDAKNPCTIKTDTEEGENTRCHDCTSLFWFCLFPSPVFPRHAFAGDFRHFETNGESAAINGLHATGLYIGVLLASPFMETPLKARIQTTDGNGRISCHHQLIQFYLASIHMDMVFLRLLIGIGDHMLHFSTQTWVTSKSTPQNRGRNISLYGLSFGLGFAVGPFMVPLVKTSPSLPFIVSGCISLAAWLFVFFLRNEHPPQGPDETAGDNSANVSTAPFFSAGSLFFRLSAMAF